MTHKYGVIVLDFPECNTKGIQFFNEIYQHIEKIEKPFESIWIPDHLAPYLTPHNDDMIEAFTTISHLSAKHPQYTYGTIVACNNFRNPALTAKMTANIATMTENRFILGIGAGWYEPEYKMYGYDFSTGGRRVRQLEEAMHIIKGMLNEDNYTFKGKYYQVENAYCNPKPATPPKIMVACHGEKYSLGIVARHADMWNMNFPTPENYQHKLDVLAKFCDKEGTDYEGIEKTIMNPVVVAGSQSEAEALAKKSVWHSMITLAGTPDLVASKMGELNDVGVDYWMLGFLPFPNNESMKLFTQEVIPLL